MQTTLMQVERQDIDAILWARAALRECIQYKEHGHDIEERDGRTICFNCGGAL